MLFSDKTTPGMAIQSIEGKVLSYINERSTVPYCLQVTLPILGERKAINKALEYIALSGKIIRLARGIYYKPKIDNEFGFGIMYPSVDDYRDSANGLHIAVCRQTGLQGRFIVEQDMEFDFKAV